MPDVVPSDSPLGRKAYARAAASWRRPWRYVPRAYVPNGLSIARLLATPVVVALLLWAPPNRIAAAAIFSLASITDYLDGYLARRWRVVSQFGVFCDLMADKLLVAATLIAMVGIGRVPPWMAIVIVGRELVVSGLRSWAAAQGVVIPAGIWGKGKTLLTLIAIAIAIIDWSGVVAFILLLGATIMTLLSALDYLYQAWMIAARRPPSSGAP